MVLAAIRVALQRATPAFQSFKSTETVLRLLRLPSGFGVLAILAMPPGAGRRLRQSKPAVAAGLEDADASFLVFLGCSSGIQGLDALVMLVHSGQVLNPTRCALMGMGFA